MTTLVYMHDDCLGHVTPSGHPERVDRLGAVERGLAGLAVERRQAPPGAEADILRCHPAGYVERVKLSVPPSGFAALDGDTFVSPGSLAAALRAVGGVCAAVDAVMAGEARNAFVGCRPPGHHAERDTAMGFCLFGNVAIAAKRALEVHGLARVAVVDFDVHHGNGTQDLLWDEARALIISSHQMPLYPGTGEPRERGAHGQILNLPLVPGSRGSQMREIYDAKVFPRLEEFAPELVLVSAGFDAHQDDPLGGLRWSADDFAWLTGRICDQAALSASGRVVSTLEGGYDLDALESCVAAHVGVLAERGR